MLHSCQIWIFFQKRPNGNIQVQLRNELGAVVPKVFPSVRCLVDSPPEVSVNQIEDQDLVRRSQKGDSRAFGILVTKYHTRIFAMVRQIVRHEHDAWDVIQEVFLKAWQSIHQFQGRSSFYTWLYRITMNLAISSLRRKARFQDVELDEAMPSSLACPGLNYQRAEIREHVHAAIAKLSPEHRAVIVMKDLEDLHYHEIAQVLNLSMGTVMSRLFHARRKLGIMLKLNYSELYQNSNQARQASSPFGANISNRP